MMIMENNFRVGMAFFTTKSGDNTTVQYFFQEPKEKSSLLEI